MALELVYDEVQESELTSDTFGIVNAARTGTIRGLARYASDLGISASTALIAARDSILPGYGSGYPDDIGYPSALLLRKQVRGVSHDEARFKLIYERPVFTTIGATGELQIIRSSGSWEMVQRVKHPASASGEDFFRVGFQSAELTGTEADFFITTIRPKLARITQRCPINILILAGLYYDAPEEMRAGMGCVNDSTFLGMPAGYWLCEDVDINKEQLFSNRIHVRVVLASRMTEDWSTWAAPADPQGFNADPRMDNVTGGYEYNVRPVDQADRDIDGILRIGMFPTADFSSLFGSPEW